MSEASLLHLAIPAPRLPHRHAREGMAVTAALHASAAAALIALTLAGGSAGHSRDTHRPAPSDLQVPRIVFLQVPGPGGGGGGGGNRNPSPPTRAENVGHDRITLPVARPVHAAPEPIDAMPAQAAALDAVPLASGVAYRMGAPSAGPSLGFSQGPGTGGGVGEGS